MKRFCLGKRLFAALLMLMLLLPAVSMAAEREWGYVKVIGTKDPYCTGDKKFAPIAVYHNLFHADESKLYLEYHYMKIDNYTRIWGIRFVDENHKAVQHPSDVDIVFPYPSIWSASQGMYWKWTNDYASRSDWDFARGLAWFHENWSVREENNYTINEHWLKIHHRHDYAARGMEFLELSSKRNIYPKYKFGFSICSDDLYDSYNVYKYYGSDVYPAVCFRIVDKPVPKEKVYDYETDSYVYYNPFYKQHLHHENRK